MLIKLNHHPHHPTSSSSSSSNPSLLFGIQFKYLSLITLTLQNSLLTLLLHYSRNIPADQLYSAPAAVLLNEILKCLISLIVAVYNSTSATLSIPPSNQRMGNISPLLSPNTEPLFPPTLNDRNSLKKPEPIPSSHLQRSTNQTNLMKIITRELLLVLQQVISGDAWKLSIPAILYVLQNNLQFIAASHLDVATFSVTYQLKILTTALCSVLMLRKRLSISKWLSLFFLAIGVGLVQLQHVRPPSPSSQDLRSTDRLIGFIAVTAACFTSGLAGVYFELVLKSSTKVDLWIRNIQLSLFSLLPALFTTFYYSIDQEGVRNQAGLFHNFGLAAWSTVLTQVIGGLVTALVIKFADNILKGFATSLSIILSTLAGVILFKDPLPLGSALGASVVLMSTYAYNQSSSNEKGREGMSTLPIRTPLRISSWKKDQMGRNKEM
ncbi:nucleotide-sugar transporter-domain-containing protein [Melampsora americana]|nr:nucleotide-sugar transporter-domain-containing protein [Melampsora americana]